MPTEQPPDQPTEHATHAVRTTNAAYRLPSQTLILLVIVAAILAMGFACRSACDRPDPEKPCDRPGCSCRGTWHPRWEPGMVPE